MEQQVSREDWRGALSPRSPRPSLELKGLLGKSKGGGSQSFPGLTADDERCYVKAPNNPQGGRVICSEYIVSAVGQLIGAPVCDVRPIHIGPEFVGIRLPSGLELVEGVGSASMAIPDAMQEGDLSHRDRNDNTRRHAGIFALHDWCWGGDSQWLRCTTADDKFFSHDHGYYIPPDGPTWNEAEILANVDTARELAKDHGGLDPAETNRLADALEAVTHAQLRDVLASVPSEWSVPDEELEAVGFFLERRAPSVAGRMRAIGAKLSTHP
jgi:hypothetical protein